MDKDLELFYNKGKTGDAKYNYDLLPLIKDFSFYDFCASSRSDEHGGFVVITNKQYIVGYNRGFGEGSHMASFARVMKDIHGGGEISERDAVMLDLSLEKEAIVARIVYEKYEDDISHEVNEQGYIHFIMGNYRINKLITLSQYQQFLKFYDKYNEELKYVCRRFNFTISYYNYDENGLGHHHESYSLDAVKEYMSKHLTDDFLVDDEIILNESRTK